MQIVGYETAPAAETEAPALVLASESGLDRQSLAPGTDLSFQLGARHCAGSLSGGAHTACGREKAPYCDRHTSRWACARCTGECSLPLESCHEEHAVYLAAFAPTTFKVGVTRSWRLETRLREQGADRAAHLRTVENGRIARQIEADIAASVGDRVRVPTKVDGLHRRVDEAAWDALVSAHDPVETYEFEYNLGVSDRPMPETIASGTVRGTQGRVLVLDRDGTPYAVDLRNLVGHEVEAGDTDRSLQSSLGAFD